MTLEAPTGGHTVELAIGGMTCSSCSARIEKKLNRMPGVEATVNFATEKAKVTFADDVTVDDLVATVEATGYTAAPPAPTPGAGAAAGGDDTTGATAADAEAQAAGDPRAVDALRQRVLGTAVLTVPVILLAMVPALQFDYWQWLSLTLAAPVVTWGAWPFHRATWVNLRHGAATMDTLVSLGVLAAFGWSLYLWLAIATIYPFGILAFHLPVPLALGSLALTAIIAIAVSVPSAPGYIGSFQLGCVAALQIFGIQKDEALAFSLIIHLTQFIGVIAAGLYSLWTENMTFSQMEAVGETDVSTA